jgi:HlyD family type I secretion membrane fusion protein
MKRSKADHQRKHSEWSQGIMLSPTESAKKDVKTMGLSRVVWIGLGVMALFFGGFGGWATTAELDSATVAPGVISVETNRKTIQHLDGGSVRKILVSDGDRVKKGQVLIALDDTLARSNLDLLTVRRRGAAALAARLSAERDELPEIEFPQWLLDQSRSDVAVKEVLQVQRNIFAAEQRSIIGNISILNQRIAQFHEEIKGLQGKIKAEEEQLRLIESEITDVKLLYEKGLTQRRRLLGLQRELAGIEGRRAEDAARIARARQQIGETQMQINELTTSRIKEAASKIATTQADLLDVEERQRAALNVLEQTIVTAPEDGIVVDLKVHTIGGVIRPGEPIMDLVPAGDVRVVEAYISPNDIDAVHLGLEARLHFPSISSRNQMAIKGIVQHVSADRLTDARNGASYYLARIKITDDVAEKIPGFDLYPGMPVEVIIVTGVRTPLEYVMRPLTASIRRAMKED